MDECCANCIYGRLICNKEKREEYVGCVQFRGFERDILLKELEDSKYVSPIPDIVFTGWVFHLPFGSCRDHYDTVKEGKVSKTKSNKQYCYLTVYYDDIVVSALPKYKTKADSFWVYKQKTKGD